MSPARDSAIPDAQTPPAGPGGRFRVLGQPVDAIDMTTMLDRLRAWSAQERSRYVCVADAHSILHARRDPAHAAALAGADTVTPDGAPLAVVGRAKGFAVSRVSGPDLLPAALGSNPSWSHFFYGGAPGVAAVLAERMTKRFPGLRVAGSLAPGRWTLDEPHDWSADLAVINAAAPTIVWVGLGCPKQERWMARHRDAIPGAILIGVGAAFDIHAGLVRRAPAWMRRWGLEWLYRLAGEPRRLWRRYVLMAPRFAALAVADVIAHRLEMAR